MNQTQTQIFVTAFVVAACGAFAFAAFYNGNTAAKYGAVFAVGYAVSKLTAWLRNAR